MKRRRKDHIAIQSQLKSALPKLRVAHFSFVNDFEYYSFFNLFIINMVRRMPGTVRPKHVESRETRTRLRCCLAMLAMLFCVLSVAAQERVVYGKVTDRRTGEPLVGATVTVSKGQGGTTADANGRYRLVIQGPQRVQLDYHYMGYRPERRELLVRDSLKCDVLMESTAKELHGITVIARSEIRKLRESAMPVSVIG